MTNLVCLEALNEAYRDLEQARAGYSKAANDLAVSREKLDHVVERAHQQQSFAPIEALFSEEEAALAVYEAAVCRRGPMVGSSNGAGI